MAEKKTTTAPSNKKPQVKRTRARYNTSTSTPKTASTRSQLEIVEESFSFLAAKGDLLATRFFERLLQDNPEMEPLFKGVSIGGQQKKFFASLVLIVQSLKQPEVLEDYMRSLGARHFNYGVTIEHYPVFINTLLAVMADLSGEKWTTEIDEAWSKTITNITDIMMASREPKVEKIDVPQQETEDEANEHIDTELVQLRSVIDGLATPIIMINRDLVVTYINQATLTTLSKFNTDIVQNFPNFVINNVMGTSLAQYHHDPSKLRPLFGDYHSFPLSQEITLGSLRFTVNISAMTDDKGQYVGNIIEWSEVAKTRVEDSLVDQLQTVMKAMSEGDLTQKLEGNFAGQSGELQSLINGAISQLSELVKQFDTAAIEMGETVNDILEDSLKLTTRTKQQTTSLAATTINLEGLAKTVQQTVDTANQANLLMDQTAKQVEKGDIAIKEAMTTIAEVNGSSKQTAQVIAEIDEIAFQTNLLALNAAVEAARSAEQRGGFTVIASELRSLAQRASVAVKEMKMLSSDNTEKIKESALLAEDSSKVLTELVSDSKQVMELVSQIAVTGTEQSQGIVRLNQEIDQASDMIKGNTTLLEQATSASEFLNEKGQNLQQLVSRFENGK